MHIVWTWFVIAHICSFTYYVYAVFCNYTVSFSIWIVWKYRFDLYVYIHKTKTGVCHQFPIHHLTKVICNMLHICWVAMMNLPMRTWKLPSYIYIYTSMHICICLCILYIFKGCRPCRRPRKRETGNGVSWLRSSVLWIVSLDALYIHYIYIYMHQIVYTCMLKWNFASSYPCHEAQASILLLSVFRGWCVLLPVRKT